MNYLDKELLTFETHPWLVRDAVQGVVCFGATGSGKTSGPLRKMALSFLNSGFGGIVLCCKNEEISDWENYAAETFRSDDILKLSELTFNFLDYERTREGAGAGQVENIVNVFVEVVDVGKKKKDSAANEEYFRNAVSQLLRNAVTLLLIGEKPISLPLIKKIIDGAPVSPAASAMGKGYCCELLKEIEDAPGFSETPEFALAKNYFLKEFPGHDPKTRSNVISSFTVIADALLRGELLRCFCPESPSTFDPDEIIAGKILIVDYSVKEWGKLGSYASAIIKFCFQKAVERRKDMGQDEMRPVFIFADECQEFAIQYDRIFLSTARSARVSNIFATQNIGNLYSTYGKEDAAAILGNLQTKIICQNGDDQTNEWAAKSIGKHIVKLKNESTSTSKNWSRGAQRSGNASTSEGWREQKDFIVDPVEFTKLQTGSVQNECTVEFVIWQPGREFDPGHTHLKTSVKQKCRLSCGEKSEYACDKNFHLPKLSRIKLSLPEGFWFPFLVTLLFGGIGWFGLSVTGTSTDFIVMDLPLEGFITFSGMLIYCLGIAFWYLPELLWVISVRKGATIKYHIGLAGDLYLCLSFYAAYLVYTSIIDTGRSELHLLLYWIGTAILAKLICAAEQHVSKRNKLKKSS